MKWTFSSTGMIIMGLFGILIIILFHEITVSNEQDYYTLKEATEASMIEAVDSAYYRLTGKVKMNQEKFVEDFTKRFIKTSTFGQGNYYVDFYQINEYPPKVSVRIVDDTNTYNIFTSLSSEVDVDPTQTRIVNELSAILDGYEIEDKYEIIDYDQSTGEPKLESPPVSESGCVAIARPHANCKQSMPNEYRNESKYAVGDTIIFHSGQCIATVLVLMGEDVMGNVMASTVTWNIGYLKDCPRGYKPSGDWCVCEK